MHRAGNPEAIAAARRAIENEIRQLQRVRSNVITRRDRELYNLERALQTAVARSKAQTTVGHLYSKSSNLRSINYECK